MLDDLGDRDGAIDALWRARRLGNTSGEDLLAGWLDERGDREEAAAIRAVAENIEEQLDRALPDYRARQHNEYRPGIGCRDFQDYRLRDFTPHLIAALDRRESSNRSNGRRSSAKGGGHPHDRDAPDYVLMSISRDDVREVRKSATSDGRQWISARVRAGAMVTAPLRRVDAWIGAFRA